MSERVLVQRRRVTTTNRTLRDQDWLAGEMMVAHARGRHVKAAVRDCPFCRTR